MAEVIRTDLEAAISYVLMQHRDLCPGKWPKGPDGSALAAKIADQFELNGWTVTRGPGAPAHATMAPFKPPAKG